MLVAVVGAARKEVTSTSDSRTGRLRSKVPPSSDRPEDLPDASKLVIARRGILRTSFEEGGGVTLVVPRAPSRRRGCSGGRRRKFDIP